jgi:hypothetical protein
MDRIGRCFGVRRESDEDGYNICGDNQRVVKNVVRNLEGGEVVKRRVSLDWIWANSDRIGDSEVEAEGAKMNGTFKEIVTIIGFCKPG